MLNRLLFAVLAAAILFFTYGTDDSHARVYTTWDEATGGWVTYDTDTFPRGPAGGGHSYTPIKRETVKYDGPHGPNTIIVNTAERRLYLVLEGGMAMKYGIGVGRDGFRWSGVHRISRKAEWPSWSPPAVMIAREKAKGRILPTYMEGGPGNPLGARALYIGSTIYRIHGTSEPWTIGQAVSSGCIRLVNEDVIDLYERVNVGAKVVVMN
jgi:lipoprotein-anchoring transpeptidase ErfK/SrfK